MDLSTHTEMAPQPFLLLQELKEMSDMRYSKMSDSLLRGTSYGNVFLMQGMGARQLVEGGCYLPFLPQAPKCLGTILTQECFEFERQSNPQEEMLARSDRRFNEKQRQG